MADFTIVSGVNDGYPCQSAAQPAGMPVFAGAAIYMLRCTAATDGYPSRGVVNRVSLSGMAGIQCLKILLPINEGYPYAVGESKQLRFGAWTMQSMAIGNTPVLCAYHKNRAVFTARHGSF